MPEKLMNIQEVAGYLGVSEEEVKRLVDRGDIPAYRIGGSFLRFRKEQLDAIRTEVTRIEEQEPAQVAPPPPVGTDRHPYMTLEREIKKREPVVRQYDYTAGERIRDFFYFYDFYIVSCALIAVLLFIIFKKV